MVASLYHVNHAERFTQLKRMAANTIAEYGVVRRTVSLVSPTGTKHITVVDPGVLPAYAAKHDALGFTGETREREELHVIYVTRGEEHAAAATIDRPHGWPVLGEWREIQVPDVFKAIYNHDCQGK